MTAGKELIELTPEQQEFIKAGSEALAEKFGRPPNEFGVIVPFNKDNSFSDKAYIGYIGLRGIEIKPDDTVKIGNGLHPINDPELDDNELRVSISIPAVSVPISL